MARELSAGVYCSGGLHLSASWAPLVKRDRRRFLSFHNMRAERRDGALSSHHRTFVNELGIADARAVERVTVIESHRSRTRTTNLTSRKKPRLIKSISSRDAKPESPYASRKCPLKAA